MRRVIVLSILTLALVANLFIPRTVWLNATCCHSTLSVVAPERLDFCGPAPRADASGDRLRIEAPNCCTSTPLTLSVALSTAPIVPVDQSLPTFVADLAMPARSVGLISTPAMVVTTAAVLNTGPPPRPSTPLYLVHARLNL